MEEFDKIVFTNKNKTYGAYLLRKKYFAALSAGLIISVVVFALVAFYAFFKSISLANDLSDLELRQEIVEYEQMALINNVDTVKVSQPPPKKMIAKKDVDIVVVDSIKQVIDTLKIVMLPDAKNDSTTTDSLASDTSRAGSANGTGSEVIYTKVDELPEFPGGFAALKQYLLKNTMYPEEAKKGNIKGFVQIQFVITKEGKIDKISVKKGANALLNSESIRVVNTFPKWKPAKRKGKPVNVWCVIPFNYQL